MEQIDIEQLKTNTRFVYKNYYVCAAVKTEYPTIDYDFWDVQFVDLSNVINILKSKQYSEYLLKENLLSYSNTRFFNDLFYLNSYQCIKKYIEDEIETEQLIFDNHTAKNDPVFCFDFNKMLKQKRSYLDSINEVIQSANDLKRLMFAIPDIEAIFQAEKAKLIIIQPPLVTMPTWAKESDLEHIWSELLSLGWVDKNDKVNFFKAFGVSKDSEPYQKIKVGDSANKLMTVLTLMVDQKKKTISKVNKAIANDLFITQLTDTKLKKEEFDQLSAKLPMLNKLRTLIVITPKSAGELNY